MESQEQIFMINSSNRAINAADDANYGEILKSGDNTLLKYKIFDGDGEILQLEGLPCEAVIKKEDIAVYRTPAEVDAENVVSFKITEVLPSDRNNPYTIEFIITQGQDTLIFPSDDRINLYMYPSSLSAEVDIIERTPEERLNEIVIVAVNDATQEFYDSYNELVDTGVIQENINQKLAESEAEYAPRLTELEQNDANLTAQLAQTEKNMRMLSYTKYGNVTLPEDFNHNIDFNIYRDIDGKMKHDFDINAHLLNWDATYIYVSQNGGAGNDGLTPETPTSVLQDALNTANNGSDTHYIIKILSDYLDKDKSIISNGAINKNIAIVADKETYIGNVVTSSSWADENGIFRWNRTMVRSVYDKNFTTIANSPMKYEQVDTLEECRKRKGTWHKDGSTPNAGSFVYVNTLDGRKPDNGVLVSLGSTAVPSFNFSLSSDVQLVFNNINIVHYWRGNNTLRVDSTGSSKGHLIVCNSKIIESANNGLMTNGIENTWLFDVVSSETQRDGLNYHNTLSGDHFIFEYNCTAFDCGINDDNENNNATTAHEEAHILRVNTKGWNTRGPVCIDVNGCYSILYDCSMFDSIRTDHANSKVAFYFADDRGITNGKATLINCEGGGEGTDLLSTSGGFEKVQVRNLKGDYTKIVNTNIEFIE